MSLRIKILVMGKPKKSYLAEGIADYLDRLQHYSNIEITEIREPRRSKKDSDAIVLKKEAEQFINYLQPADFLVVLDRRGKMMDSRELADFLQNCMNQNVNPVTFLIGGELGVDDSILGRANQMLSLSKMTFTHDMSRLILLEQLYRGFTILAGQKYHK